MCIRDRNYLEYRIGQVRYLGDILTEAGVPIYRPVGGHAVYVQADKFLDHIPREQYPAWALTVGLYREAGVRAVEIGGVMFGKKDPATGREILPELELVRLTIPRRVYTISHMHYIAEALAALKTKKDSVRGLRIVYQAPHLRHFTARLEEI